MTVQSTLPRPAHGLRKNLIYSVGGNTIFALGSWVSLILIAKLTDAATMGQYVLALAVTAPIFLFSNLQLREVQATDHEATPFGSYLSSRLATAGLALLASLGFALTYDGTTRLVILLTAAAKGLDAVIDIVYGAWLRQERQRLVAASLAMRGATTVLIMGAALVLTHSIVVACAASMFQSAVSVLHVRAVYLRENDLRLAPLDRADWLRLGALVPLGLAVAFDSLAINVPRYFIESGYGLAMVGVFGAIGAFMQLGGSTVAVGLAQVGIPRLSKRFDAGDAPGFLHLLKRLLAAGIGLGLVGILISLLFGREILATALGKEYAPYTTLLNWTMLNALVWYVGGIFACGVTATRNFKVQFPIFGAGLTAVSLTSLLFIPRYGLEGASASILAGFIVRALANSYVALRALKTL